MIISFNCDFNEVNKNNGISLYCIRTLPQLGNNRFSSRSKIINAKSFYPQILQRVRLPCQMFVMVKFLHFICTDFEFYLDLRDFFFVFTFAVIDFCLTKCLMVDSATGFSSLRLCWAAQDNCTQRSGRAGRIADGRCYRMVTKRAYTVRYQFIASYRIYTTIDIIEI